MQLLSLLQPYAYLIVEFFFLLWYIKHKERRLLVTDAPQELPIDGQPEICLAKIAAQFSRRGGYFCVLLVSLLPMAYPRPNAVSTRLITAINPSIVNIHSALLSQIPFQVSMYMEGHSPSGEG